MDDKKRSSLFRRLALRFLALVLLVSFFTGCDPNNPGNQTGGGSGNTDTPDPKWTSVQLGTEIDTLNVVLVIDTSASTADKDPDRNWLESACMFLDALYASASKQASDRLPGSKRAYVSAVLYNDTADSYSDTLVNLSTASTVDSLRGFISTAKTPEDSGDDALAEALDKAVSILLHKSSTRQEGLSERSSILLFTDGYTSYDADRVLSQQNSTQGSDFSGGASSDAASGFAYGGAALPNFGDSHQEQLEKALKRAKDNNCEIFVLMLNPEGRNDGEWEQFKRIADYTKRNFMERLIPALVLIGTDARFEGMPRGADDLTWPEDYTMLSPAFLSDPMYGGGVFDDPTSEGVIKIKPSGMDEKVTYLTAETSDQLMSFYTTMASNMLSGSSAEEHTPRVETIRYENEAPREALCYDIDVPDSGVSALMCYFFSNNGISDIYLTGPNPNNSDERVDYQRLSFQGNSNMVWKDNQNGWKNNDTMRNGWYPHKTSTGEWQSNIASLTIINPVPGTWNIFLCEEDGKHQSMHAYTSLVNGAKVDIKFRQGNNPVDLNLPVTRGDIAVRVSNHDGNSMTEEFYNSLDTKCSATRIPPWFPLSGEADIVALMSNPTAWVGQALATYQKPEKWLSQMSGRNIYFEVEKDEEGIPFLLAQFDAPLPGLYYVTLDMTSSEVSSKLDYSKSFWVMYEPRTDFQVNAIVNQDIYLSPPFLPDAWAKTSNTSVAENLLLNIEGNSLKITPSDLATVQIDPSDSQSIVIHPRQKGEGTLSFNVSTEYGDRWSLKYDVIIK